MKFIFDFDNVLFHTTKHFKEHMFDLLEKDGIPRNLSKEYYDREKNNCFSLKKMLVYFSVSQKLYEKIMQESKNFVNEELLEVIKKIGKSNCLIITYGEEKFQLDKIKRAGVASLFSEIFVVPSVKKEIVEKICEKHKGEQVIFVDDKGYNFQDLDFKKYPNLKTILYDEQGLEKLKKEINNNQ